MEQPTEKADKNFIVPRDAERPGLTFYNVQEPPFAVYGLTYENGKYRRVPEALAKQTNDGVYILHANTAGGRVRFVTDSPYVALRAEMPAVCKMPHFSLTGSAGFDLYADGEYLHTFVPPYDVADGYCAAADFDCAARREITVHFPLYSDVAALYIGVKKGSLLEPAAPYSITAPILYYGSSITQGGCASRPGTAYQNLLTRWLNADHRNLGFSGSAKGEACMAEYIAAQRMSAFVLDYDHNAPTPEHLAATHEPFFLTVRAAQPTLPVIFMSRPQHTLTADGERRLEIIRKTYENALAAGDKNVYLLTGPELTALCGNEGTVDGCHPTDFGFYAMARALLPVLRRALGLD